MKIKTLACLCALAAVPAFGNVAATSGNTFGVLKVTCSAQKVIIATPWVECGDATASVSVSNLVMTSGLAQGDSVLLYQGGTFRGWSINASGNWEAMNVTVGDTTYNSGANAAIARGEAFWFVKNSFTAGDTYDLYLYGQDTSAAATTTITAGDSTSPSYWLLASPNVGGVDLATASWSGMTINAEDRIVVPNGANAPTEYSYKGGVWGTLTTQTTTNGRKVSTWAAVTGDVGKIPAGRGFWYVSKGGSGTITW